MITFENINDFSNLEIIDYLSDKLLNQGCKSIDSLGQCKYRGGNNTKCAIGFLFTDEIYKKYEPEGFAIEDLHELINTYQLESKIDL